MGGTAAKTLLVLAIAALLAFGLAACGGDSDDSTGSTSTAAGGGETAKQAPEPADGKGNQKQGGDEEGGATGSDRSPSEGDSGSSGSGSGEGSAAFRTPGGDNSIQDFGEEADGEELGAAEAALVAYLDARAGGDWAKSCEYLAKAAVQPLEQLAESSPKLKGKGCAAIIGALMSQVPASSRANPLGDGVASLRFEGERGFALFHGPKGVDYFVPMVKEGDEWKVGAMAPSEFP